MAASKHPNMLPMCLGFLFFRCPGKPAQVGRVPTIDYYYLPLLMLFFAVRT